MSESGDCVRSVWRSSKNFGSVPSSNRWFWKFQTNIPENVKFLEISTIKRSPILVIFGFCDFQAWCFQKYFFIDFRKQLDHSFVVVIVGNFFTSFRVENNVLTDRAQKERTGIRSPCMNNLHDPYRKRPDVRKVAKYSKKPLMN